MKHILHIGWLLAVAIFAIYLERPIEDHARGENDFSASRVVPHIEAMAARPHFTGTAANDSVQSYILNAFDAMGIPAEVSEQVSFRQYAPSYIRIGQTRNIVAIKKGTTAGKAVLVAAHYDSVLNSPGAGDDVHAVACMLEVARLLAEQEHRNDIIFLITDGEETGLFGAKAYTENQDLSTIGVMLNFEARGNSGPSMAFEWSDDNAWLVDQYAQVAKRPVANSLSYEIYKFLPNDTDFTPFKEAGVPGINSAFIDGFSYYHNPADTPAALNMNSVQHTGENMWRLTRHFASVNFESAKPGNATFFNYLGFVVRYPSRLNVFLFAGLIFLFLFTIRLTNGKERIGGASFILSFLGLLGSLAMGGLLAFALGKLLFLIYPHYKVFYSGQFYNHMWYLWSTVAIGIITMWGTLSLLKKHHYASFRLSILLVFVMASAGLLIYMPSATYFVLLPAIALCAAQMFHTYEQEIGRPVSRLIYLMLAGVVVALWAPSLIPIHLSFSLALLPGPAILSLLLCTAIFIILPDFWETKLPLWIGSGILLASLLIAHWQAYPSKHQPLPSSAYYLFNAADSSAFLTTSDSPLNVGNRELLNGATDSVMSRPLPVNQLARRVDVRPAVFLPVVTADTSRSGSFQIEAADRAFQYRITFSHTRGIHTIDINEALHLPISHDKALTLDLFGFGRAPLHIGVDGATEADSSVVWISTRFEGMPVPDILPVEAVRKDGYSAIVQRLQFITNDNIQ